MNHVVMAIALPLLGAFLLPLVQRVSGLLAAVTGPALLVASGLLLHRAWTTLEQPVQIALGGFAPPFGISLYLDGLALLFALLVPIASLLLWHWGRDAEDARRQSLVLLLAAASTGLALSGDLFNLYVFYELAAVASYGLVSGRDTAAGFAAAFRYLVISALGSVFALVGIAIVYFNTGSLNLVHLAGLGTQLAGPENLLAFALLLIGFGVKAELFPVNAWVPEVYGAAPTRVSALLAGLVSKLALLVIVRLMLTVFPDESARELLLVLGILGMLAGELAALRARDMRRMLALSSVGQLGVVFIAFSIPGVTGLIAGLAVALHHAVVKPGLFLLATRWGGRLDGLQGAWYRSPLGAAALALFALSLVGLPPLPGFWAKWLVASGLALSGDPAHLLALGALLVATVVEATYLVPLVTRLFQRGETSAPTEAHAIPDIAGSLALAAVLVMAALAIDPLWTGLSDLAVEAGGMGPADVLGLAR